jgi:predicted HicB family RNase H-like nuclease
VAEDIRMFSVGGKRHRYDPELHSQLIAEAAAVGKISFNFLSGPLFRALQLLLRWFEVRGA